MQQAKSLMLEAAILYYEQKLITDEYTARNVLEACR